VPDVADAPAPVPAATVIVVRDGRAGPEVLMLKRNSKLAFGGMWVFPGGRVDPADVPDGEAPDGVAAARRAAAREAVEEADLRVPEADLVLFSRWTPPPEAPKRFTTWFFVAAAPEGGEVTVDGGEIHEHEWVGAAEMLRRRDAGEVELAPPRWVSLWRLLQAGTVEHALDEARTAEVEHFVTRVAALGDRRATVWQGDAAYTTGDLEAPGGRHRLWMDATGWTYERA